MKEYESDIRYPYMETSNKGILEYNYVLIYNESNFSRYNQNYYQGKTYSEILNYFFLIRSSGESN